jgi:hypothetical protein
MDATNMNFRNRSFDIVIDKGTYDAIAVTFTQSDLGTSKVINLVQEMGRIANKYAIIITYGSPEMRSTKISRALQEVGNWEENVIDVELNMKS